MKYCGYCRTEWNADRRGNCSSCGAPGREEIFEKSGPFFEEGMIVYAIRDYCCMRTSFIFYRGMDYVGKVDITDRERMEWQPGVDYMPEIMSRLSTFS